MWLNELPSPALVMKEFLTHSAEETTDLGRRLAAELSPPKLVVLRGELGAGKTTLIKGIAEGFQAASQENVTSPTFTLIHEYRGPGVNVYHVDLYRVDTQRELDTLGLDDLFDEEQRRADRMGREVRALSARARRGDHDRAPRRE